MGALIDTGPRGLRAEPFGERIGLSVEELDLGSTDLGFGR